MKASEQSHQEQAESLHPESWIVLPLPPLSSCISLGDGAYLFGSSTNPEKRCPEVYF